MGKFVIKWAVIALALLLAFIVVQSYLPDVIASVKARPANPTTDWLLGLFLDWWLVFAIIAAILAVLVFTKPSFGWVKASFKTGGFWMALLTSSLVLATFFFLLSKIYPNAPLFEPGEGYGHIALYFLLGGLMAMVAANLKGKAWFVNFVLVILMFAMIGHRTADLLDPSGKLSARIASIISFGGNSGAQVASTTPQCRRVKQEVLFGYDPVKVNQAAACKSDLWFDGHCIYLQRASWTNDRNVYRTCGGLLPKDIEWAWSADVPFRGAILLSPPEYR